MKKSVLSILTFCFVFMGVLAFSCPVFADSSHDGLSFTGTSPSFYIGASIGAYKNLVPNTTFYDYDYVATGEAGSFFVDMPLQLGNLPSNDRYLFSSVCGSVRIYGSYASRFVSETVGSNQPVIRVVSRSLLCNGVEIPINPSGNYFDVTFNLNGVQQVALYNTFVLRTYIKYTANISSTTSGSGVNYEWGYYHLSATCDSLNYRMYSSIDVSSSDISKQTTDINNNITQQTQQQTESLQNGYDNSSMTDDNTRLNSQIDQYDQAQEETTNKSTAYIDGAEFVNPFSNATVLVSVTFATSFLQSLFMNLDIWQLVVTVSLCLVLALMLVGWFKFRGD